MKNNNSKFKDDGGFGLLEIVLSVAIISGSLFAIAGASRLAFIASSEGLLNSQAGFILEEGVEALKTIRDQSWASFSSISMATSSYLVFEGGAWKATSTNPGPISNIFTRIIELQSIFRDANGNIAGAGTPDPDTRKVIVRVSWRERTSDISREAVSYISRIND